MATTHRPGAVSDDPDEDVPYVLGADVLLLTDTDGSARLLDLGGDFYTVSAVGTEMLRETLAHGPGAAVRQIAERYRAEAGGVRADLHAFLGELVRRGLLRRGRHAPRRRAALASLVCGPRSFSSASASPQEKLGSPPS